MRLSFHIFIQLFIHSLHSGLQRELLTIPAAGRLSMTIKISDICYNLLVILHRRLFVCLSVCLSVCLLVCQFVGKITQKLLCRF